MIETNHASSLDFFSKIGFEKWYTELIIYILLDGDKIVSSVTVKLTSIEDVFVSPDYQGKGIGKKMLHFAINKAIDLGSSHIELSAIEWNKRALQLYRGVGFKNGKTIHYLRLFGHNEDNC